jgi:hypothetical protein
LCCGVSPLAVGRRQEVTLKKSIGYNPDGRFAAALIAHAIKTARRIESPNNQEARVSALRAIEWLARPESADLWFDMAGFEYDALVERLPLERWIARGRDLLASDARLREAVT